MQQVKAGTLQLAFCWAHVRRDFLEVARGWPELEAWAFAWLKQIRELYRLNRQRRNCPAGSAEFLKHQGALQAAVSSMQTQFTQSLADNKLRLPCRQVLESLQHHWPGLTRFVTEPRIPMDNNRQERLLRGPVLGRKNYYGSGCRWAARLAAMMFSLFATLTLWKLNPRAWLTWYLQSCAEAGCSPLMNVEPFLPWNLSPERRAALSRAPPPPPSDTS
jgi:transposase